MRWNLVQVRWNLVPFYQLIYFYLLTLYLAWTTYFPNDVAAVLYSALCLRFLRCEEYVLSAKMLCIGVDLVCFDNNSLGFMRVNLPPWYISFIWRWRRTATDSKQWKANLFSFSLNAPSRCNLCSTETTASTNTLTSSSIRYGSIIAAVILVKLVGKMNN